MTRLLAPGNQGTLLGIMLVVLLVAGLHPFNFLPKNRFRWMADSRGGFFRGYAEVVGSSPLALDDADAGSGITVELWVSSLNEDAYVKDLVSFYISRTQEPFAVEQWGKKLIIGGMFRDAQGHRKFRHIGLDNVFATGARRFVTLTSGPEGTKIYLEGALQGDFSGVRLERENFDGTLLLGQTASARQEWLGAIFGLALYANPLPAAEVAMNYAAWQRGDVGEIQKRTSTLAIYPFDEQQGNVAHNRGNLGADLTIPKRLRPVDAIVLEIPSRRDFTNVSDVAINILGFIPFGGLLVIYLKTSRGWSNHKVIILAILVGLLISLAIELLQVLLPTRDSSLLDLMNNTLGTGIGAGLGVAAWPTVERILRTRPSTASAGRADWRWER